MVTIRLHVTIVFALSILFFFLALIMNIAFYDSGILPVFRFFAMVVSIISVIYTSYRLNKWLKYKKSNPFKGLSQEEQLLLTVLMLEKMKQKEQ